MCGCLSLTLMATNVTHTHTEKTCACHIADTRRVRADTDKRVRSGHMRHFPLSPVWSLLVFSQFPSQHNLCAWLWHSPATCRRPHHHYLHLWWGSGPGSLRRCSGPTSTNGKWANRATAQDNPVGAGSVVTAVSRYSADMLPPLFVLAP